MDAATGQEHRVAGFNFDAVKTFSHGSGLNLLFESPSRNPALKSHKKFSAGLGMSDIPKLGFGLAFEFRGALGGRMHLQGKRLTSIENFNEQRKSVSGCGVAKEFALVMLQQPVKIVARERAVGDDTYVTGPVGDLPRLTYGHS